MAREETIIINDLLSFLSSKLHMLSKEKIIESIISFYPESEIQEAFRTLISSLPIKQSTKTALQVKKNNPVIAMYECVVLIPKEELPVFACRNLDNVPQVELDVIKMKNSPFIIKPVSDFDKFKDEHKNMKVQISEIASIVGQLNDQLQILLDTTTLMMEENPSKRMKMDAEQIANSQVSSENKPLKGLAYLQKLIDEENEGENEFVIKNSETFVEGNAIVELDGIEEEVDDTDVVMEPEPRTILLKDKDSTVQVDKAISDVVVDTPPPVAYSEVVADSNPEVVVNNQCHICCKVFESPEILDDHMKVHSAQSVFPCILCGEKFEDSVTLLEHYKQCLKSSKEKLMSGKSCNICNLMFSDELDLEEHADAHSEARPYICTDCLFKFPSQKMLDVHIKKRHTPECIFTCPFCAQTFGIRSELAMHIKLHLGLRQNKSMVITSPANRPSENSNTDAAFKCDSCNEIFPEEKQLEVHKSRKHKMDYVKCNVCQKNYVVGQYKSHMAMHAKEKLFKCPHCPYTASTNGYLTVHMQTHEARVNKPTPKPPVECNICNHLFKTPQALTSHMRVHSKK